VQRRSLVSNRMNLFDQTATPHRANAVQRALAHPLRARLLLELRNGEASPSQLADTLLESVSLVSYHVRVLAEAGLVELAGTTPSRGALQHFYRSTSAGPVGTTLMVSAEAAERLLQEVREAIWRAELEPGDVPVVLVAHHQR
jgi:DNA-binding transcriptional ArsR family regulator